MPDKKIERPDSKLPSDKVDPAPFVERFKNAPAQLTDDGKPVAPPAAQPPPTAPVPETPPAPPPEKSVVPDFKPTTPPPPPAPEPPKPPPDGKPTEPPKPGSKEFNFAALSKAKDEIETKFKTAEKELADLKAKLADATKAPTADELEAMRKERDQYAEIVSRTALEADPRFKAAFDNKIESMTKDTLETLDAEAAPAIGAILKMPAGKERDNAMKEAVAELDDFSKGTLIANYQEIKRLEKGRADELAKAKDVKKQLEAYEQQQRTAKQAELLKHRQTYADVQLKQAAEVWPEFRRTGDPDHDKTVDETTTMVRNWLDKIGEDMSPGDTAKMAVYAARGVRATQLLEAQNAIIGKLQEQVKSLTAATPDLSKPGAVTPKGPDLSVDEIKRRWREGPPS